MKRTATTILLTVIFYSYAFADSPPNLTTNIPWTDSGGSGNSASYGGVADIEDAFNNARRQEELQLGINANTLTDLVLPTQEAWDTATDDTKALFLLNNERTARAGMLAGVLGLPFAGIEQNIDNISEYYAQFLHDNDATGHNADGSGGPFARIDNDPEIGIIKNCHDFLPRAENLSYFATTGTNIPLPIERSIYGWVYDDGGSSWGHREMVLLQDIALNSQSGFQNNNGSLSDEGFVGFHHITSGDYQPFSSFPSNTGSVVVMNFFSPVSDANAGQRNCNYIVTLPQGDLFNGENETLKRAEMAKAILQAKNIIPPATPTGMEYTDILADNPYAVWVEKFKSENFTEGCSLDKFCPNNVVSRESMAKIFLKAKFGADHVPTPTAALFADVPSGSFNELWITELRELGFTQGCDTNKYCPKEAVTKLWFNILLNNL